MIEDIKEELTIDNPEYIDKIKRKAWIGNTPMKIKLYEIENNSLITGPGFISRLGSGMNYNILLESNKENCNINFKGKLYKYQNRVFDLIYNYFKDRGYFRGIISSPTGSGKTIMAVAIATMTNKKVLWIVNSNDLMEQAIEAFNKFTLQECGRLNASNKQHIDNFNICVSTIQTLQKLTDNEFDLINNIYDCVIVDECHHTPAKYFTEALSKLTPIFMLGLTATPIRKDAMQDKMFNVIGDIIYQISRDELKESLIFPKVEIIKIRELIECFVSSDNYVEYLKEVVFNQRRFDITLEIFKKYHKGKALILVEFVELGEMYKNEIQKMFPNKTVEFVHGSIKKVDRKRIIQDTRDGKIDILIGTKLAREGLDIPILNELFLFTPKKGDSTKNIADGTTLEQEIGRIMRIFENKKGATVYDIVDYNFEIFKRQMYSRNRTYKRLGLETNQNNWSKPSATILGIDIY